MNDYINKINKCIRNNNGNIYYSLYSIMNMLCIDINERYKIVSYVDEMYMYLKPVYKNYLCNYILYAFGAKVNTFLHYVTGNEDTIYTEEYYEITDDILLNPIVLYRLSLNLFRNYDIFSAIINTTCINMNDLEMFNNTCNNREEIYRRVKSYRCLNKELYRVDIYLNSYNLNNHKSYELKNLVLREIFGHSEKRIKEMCNIDPYADLYNHANTLVLNLLSEIYYNLFLVLQCQNNFSTIKREVTNMCKNIKLNCKDCFINTINNYRDNLLFPNSMIQ